MTHHRSLSDADIEINLKKRERVSGFTGNGVNNNSEYADRKFIPPSSSGTTAMTLDDMIKRKPRKMIGNYRLTKTIGQGSMGKVKLAINQKTGEKRACKIIPRPAFTEMVKKANQLARKENKYHFKPITTSVAATVLKKYENIGETNTEIDSSLKTNPSSTSISSASSTSIYSTLIENNPIFIDSSTPLTQFPELYPKETANSQEIKENRIIREAAIVLHLHHPHIAFMDQFVAWDNYYYFFFEYVNGGQMLDYIISHGRLKEKQARKFIREIISAVGKFVIQNLSILSIYYYYLFYNFFYYIII